MKKCTGIVVAVFAGQVIQLILHYLAMQLSYTYEQIGFCVLGGIASFAILWAGMFIMYRALYEEGEHEREAYWDREAKMKQSDEEFEEEQKKEADEEPPKKEKISFIDGLRKVAVADE